MADPLTRVPDSQLVGQTMTPSAPAGRGGSDLFTGHLLDPASRPPGASAMPEGAEPITLTLPAAMLRLLAASTGPTGRGPRTEQPLVSNQPQPLGAPASSHLLASLIMPGMVTPGRRTDPTRPGKGASRQRRKKRRGRPPHGTPE
ncbi:hypothetical protein [Yunchengibacter salinarum]|uniref:hypothetical protein n=1 Tax=Yunchengibacter salinarum TaxID=3133399 RepID=UPI0035B5BED3